MKSEKQKPEDGKQKPEARKPEEKKKEIGGRGGLDPVRFGDWEIAGKCVDF